MVEFYRKIYIIKPKYGFFRVSEDLYLIRIFMFTIETGEENTILRTKSEPLKMNEIAQYRAIGNDMVKFIRDPKNGAAGLAAPQIGINKRFVAVSLLRSYSDEDFRSLLMINPEILEHSEEKYIDDEGCLSIPGEE